MGSEKLPRPVAGKKERRGERTRSRAPPLLTTLASLSPSPLLRPAPGIESELADWDLNKNREEKEC